MQATVDPPADTADELTDGDRLRKAREDKGLSRKALAAKLIEHGYQAHPQSIYYWETDRRPVARFARPHLLAVLGFELPWRRP